MPDEKGETRRQRNEKFAAAAGAVDPTPQTSLPEQGEHLWHWFWQLSPRRRTGPEAISYEELGAWQRLLRIPLRPEEAEILMEMDDAFLSEIRKEQQDAHTRASERK